MILEVVNIGIPSDPTVPSVFPSSHLSDFLPSKGANGKNNIICFPCLEITGGSTSEVLCNNPQPEIQAKEKAPQAFENHALRLDGKGVLVC